MSCGVVATRTGRCVCTVARALCRWCLEATQSCIRRDFGQILSLLPRMWELKKRMENNVQLSSQTLHKSSQTRGLPPRGVPPASAHATASRKAASRQPSRTAGPPPGAHPRMPTKMKGTKGRKVEVEGERPFI